MFDIEEELKKLPADPGVYIMHDKRDTVIYVGKAKVLKNRVRQYFHKSAAHTPKVKAMVANIAYFEYIITDSEIEALVLECTLIKKYRPKYNILLKDDKQYPYIKVTLNEEYPRIMMTRTIENDGAKYFGPYMGMNTVKNTLDIVKKIFIPPTCSRKFPDDIGKGRPCLNYHIKNCFAPCRGTVTKEEYRQVYYDICTFIDGKHKELLELLEREMNEASQKLQFEKAALMRDRIRSIKALEEKQKIVNADDMTDRDIIALAMDKEDAFAEVFFIRNGRVYGRENYRLSHVAQTEPGAVMSDFLKQFYSISIYIPKEIHLSIEPDDALLLNEWLDRAAGRKVNLSVPKKGEKKRLVDMVQKNADLARDNNKAQELSLLQKNNVLSELQKTLGMEKLPYRIESYDISNISGTNNVASMVVFENGRAENKKYRKFKIKTFEGADDYRAMQEILHRRFLHALKESEKIENGEMKEEEAKFLPLPDLILADGGKGHVRACKEMLEMMEQDIPVYGMVKDDRHRTKGLTSEEGEIEINMTSPLFKLITRIQDEVHRSAISYHRQLRGKNTVKSILDDIPGIGEKKRNILLKEFGSVENIKSADINKLKSIKGITEANAVAIKDFFNKDVGSRTDL